MNTVSSASITGMVVSLILCVAAPVALCVLLKRKPAQSFPTCSWAR